MNKKLVIVFGIAMFCVLSTSSIVAQDKKIRLVNGQKMILKVSGVNVGIGTSAPKTKLHVAGGSIYIASPNSLIITSPNGTCWFITVNNAGGLSTIPVVPCP